MGDLDILIEAAIEPVPYDKGARVVPGKSGRPRAAVFTATKTKQWQRKFAALAAPQKPAEMISEIVRVDVLAVMPRPQRLMRKKDPGGLDWLAGRPDGDNVRKAAIDALRDWWLDDALVVAGQTVRAVAEKGGPARTVVRIRTLRGMRIQDVIEPVFGAVELLPEAVSG